MQEVWAIHKDHLPDAEDDFMSVDRQIGNYVTFMTKELLDKTEDYGGIWIMTDKTGGGSECKLLTRDDYRYRSDYPLTAYFKIPNSELPTVSVRRDGNHLMFSYEKNTTVPEYVKAILVHHDGKYEHGYSEVLFAFVGSEKATQKALEKKLAETTLTGFKFDRMGNIHPSLEKYREKTDEVELTHYEYRHHLTFKEILDKAERVEDPPKLVLNADDVDTQLLDIIATQGKIEAIKVCREHFHFGLKEAKNYIDSLDQSQKGSAKSVVTSK